VVLSVEADGKGSREEGIEQKREWEEANKGKGRIR
jgi:hypothetical protein